MPTATDPRDPAHVLAAIERMKVRVAETVATELEFEKTRKTRSLKLAQEITRREETDAAALATKLAELEASYQTATAARERGYELGAIETNEPGKPRQTAGGQKAPGRWQGSGNHPLRPQTAPRTSGGSHRQAPGGDGGPADRPRGHPPAPGFNL